MEVDGLKVRLGNVQNVVKGCPMIQSDLQHVSINLMFKSGSFNSSFPWQLKRWKIIQHYDARPATARIISQSISTKSANVIFTVVYRTITTRVRAHNTLELQKISSIPSNSNTQTSEDLVKCGPLAESKVEQSRCHGRSLAQWELNQFPIGMMCVFLAYGDFSENWNVNSFVWHWFFSKSFTTYPKK